MTKDKFRKFATAVLVVWLISLIVIGASYYFVIIPQKAHLKKLFSKVEHEIETNLVASQVNEKKAKELMDMKMEEADELVRNFLVRRSEVSDFIFDFKRMADAGGISDFTGSYDPSTSYSNIVGFKTLSEGNLRINFTGDYGQFINMLNNFERYKPFVFVDRFDMSRVRQQKGGSTINMTLTYYAVK